MAGDSESVFQTFLDEIFCYRSWFVVLKCPVVQHLQAVPRLEHFKLVVFRAELTAYQYKTCCVPPAVEHRDSRLDNQNAAW